MLKEQAKFSNAWREFFNQNFDLFIDKAPDLTATEYYDYFFDKDRYVSVISPILYKPDILRKYENKIVKHYFTADSTGVKYSFILQLSPKNHLTFTVFYLDEEGVFYGAFLFCGAKAEYFKDFIEDNKGFEVETHYKAKIGF